MASELLKVALKPTCSNSEVKLIDGASGHTYTILSITICETAGNAETFDLAANATFEHTSKFVIEGTDHLCAATASSANVDIVVSYLDQTL